METNREKVARLIGDAATKVLTRAMRESGMCCAAGRPLCSSCSAAVTDLRQSLSLLADKIPQDSIDRLASAPDEAFATYVEQMIEPDFRKAIAADLPS